MISVKFLWSEEMQRELATSKGNFFSKGVCTVFLKSQRQCLAPQVWFLVYLPLLSAEPSLFSGAAACGAEAYPQGVVLVGILLCWIRWARMFLHCLGEDIKARPCFLFGVTTFLCLCDVTASINTLAGMGKEFS